MNKSNGNIHMNEILRRVAEVQAQWSATETTRREEVGARRREQFLTLIGLSETRANSPSDLIAA